MPIYSIGDLERITGVKSHTIRIWEKRYDIINPKRTKKNIRYYEEDELRKLLYISILRRNGYRISEIAKMSDKEVGKLVAQISEVDLHQANQLDALSLSLLDLNPDKFNHLLDRHIQYNGFEDTMLDIVYPLIDKMGVLYLSGSINHAQENFINFIIRQKIIAAIDRIKDSLNPNAPKFLLFLPETDNQEMILLFSHFLLKKRGFRVLNVMNIDLIGAQKACEKFQPKYVFTILNELPQKSSRKEYLDALFDTCSVDYYILSGYHAKSIDLNNKIKIIEDVNEFISYLNGLSDALQLMDAASSN